MMLDDPIRLCLFIEGGATPGSDCRRRGRDAEPRGTSRTSRRPPHGSDAVRRCSQACQKSIRTSGRATGSPGRSNCRTAASADSDDPDVGARAADMCDFACELRLQACEPCRLLQACGEIEGLQTLAAWFVVEGNRARRRPRARRPRTAVLAEPTQRHFMIAVERHRGADRLAGGLRPRRHDACPASRAPRVSQRRAWSVRRCRVLDRIGVTCRRIFAKNATPLPAPCSDRTHQLKTDAEPPAASR